MDKIEEAVATAFLRACPPAEAVAWLRDRPTRESGFGEGLIWDGEQTAVERLLVERDDPYILYGIARYGRSIEVIEAIWPTLDHPLRMTARLHHPFANFLPELQDPSKVSDDEFLELFTLALRTGLARPPMDAILGRQGAYAVLDDERYALVLERLGDNPRLTEPYDPRWLDGGADYLHHKPIQEAWELVFKLEPNQVFARALSGLLRKAQPPFKFDAMAALRRWSIDPPPDPNELYRVEPSSCYLRYIFAMKLPLVPGMRDSDDLAIRWSYYIRFTPKGRDEIWSAYERDGRDFIDYALDNPNIWMSWVAREELNRICWEQVKAERSDMTYHNNYRDAERRWKEKRPEWFGEVPYLESERAVEEPFEPAQAAVPEPPAPRKRGLFGLGR